MGKIIASLNEKGGVGKTTTVKNLSVGLAMKGKKVLAIDLDPSANLTKALGIEVEADTPTIYDVFAKGIECEDMEMGYGIIPHKEGIDVIASIDALHDMETKLGSAFQREVVLRRYLKQITDMYDYILLDCPAGLGIFTTNALFAADELIIPVSPQYLSVEAMQVMFKQINIVRRLNGTKTKPELLGILFTMVRTNVNNDKKIMSDLREAYSQINVPIFDTIIPLASKMPESDWAGRSIYSYASNSASSLIHMELVEELLKREE